MRRAASLLCLTIACAAPRDASPPAGDTATAAALAHVARRAPAWGVRADALPDLEPLAEVPVRGVTIARLRQALDGLPIAEGELRVLVGADGVARATAGTLTSRAAPRGPAVFALDDDAAIARAIGHAHGIAFEPRALAEVRAARGGSARFLAGPAGTSTIDVQLARAHRAWHRPIAGGALVAAWIVEAYTSRATATDGDAFRTVVAGDDGRVLEHRSLVADAEFTYRVFAEPTGDRRPLDGPIADVSPHPTGVPDGSYPETVPSTLVTVDGLNHPAGAAGPDPWLPGGATETIGNHVDAYADLHPPSGRTFGDFRAITTGAGRFDRAYDTAVGPLVSQDQQMAAITSLFYSINWLHDFWYDAGFTEAAGNAQDNNYGRGGEDRDAMLAEAQDNALGGSRNNANMATPGDGMPPRMQVFLWSGIEDRELTLQPTARSPATSPAAFGPGSFDVTAPLVRGADGEGDNPRDGCTPLATPVAGAIVLLDRGNCTFKTKVKHVQEAGGLGVVIANHLDGDPPTMGNDAAITEPIAIGALAVRRDDGALIAADLDAGAVTARLRRVAGPEVDGSVDATLVAHEYGHYVHHRLAVCGARACAAMSEGWGDFLALLLMARAGDDLRGAFPFAVYVTQGFARDSAYYGIRRAPYSVDPALNALSYRHMANGEPLPDGHPMLRFGNNADVHNAGEVWAVTMWEAYVALQEAGAARGASFDDVRARMAAYVVAGLMLTPPHATPTEARDAILAAIDAIDPADHAVVAAAFARRGLGSCAASPPRESVELTGLAESYELRGHATIEAVAFDDTVDSCDDDGLLDAGETGRLAATITNRGHVALAGVTVTASSPTAGVEIDTPVLALGELAPGASRDVAFDVRLADVGEPVAGALALVVATPGGCADRVEIALAPRLDVDEVASSSATDRFDAPSVWRPLDGVGVWSQVAVTALDSRWVGAPLARASDTSLVSPVLAVAADAPLVIELDHRYDFEAHDGDTFDGGMIEYSTDLGATWHDVATLATPGYDGVISTTFDNPLGGRAAYTGTNPSYPAMDRVRLELGPTLAGAQLLVRFRIGTDSVNGSPGWEIDDVAFTGIVGTPFPELVPDRCAFPGPRVFPPDGCCDAGPPRAGAFALVVAVLAVVRRRRRG